MKNLSKLVGLLLIALMFQECSQKEDIEPSKEKILFSFNLGSTAGGRISSSQLPLGTSIRLTIKKSTGETVADMQPLEIMTMGGDIISAPIELPTGNYQVNDFLLVNTSGSVIYATPKSGSTMASLVVNALSRNFSVNAGHTSNVGMEVVEIANYAASDFGYSTFDLTVIHPLKISVFAPATGGGWKHVSASAFIMNGPDTLQTLAIGAKITLVSFNQNTDTTFNLLVIQDAYARYTQAFNYHDIVAALNGEVLKIYLTPAFTFVTNVLLNGDYESDSFSAGLDYTMDANLTVDWGDGTSEVLTEQGLEHYYLKHQNFVTITGDLDKITGFTANYGWGILERVNFDYLPELKNLNLAASRKARTIDLTHNPKLEYLFCEFIENTKTILLPTQNKLNDVNLDFASSLTTATLSAVIEKLYASVAADNRHGGRLSYMKNLYDTELVWKLTSSAQNKVQLLKDVYEWKVISKWEY